LRCKAAPQPALTSQAPTQAPQLSPLLLLLLHKLLLLLLLLLLYHKLCAHHLLCL
jgi:hypothetical protein